MNKYVITFTSGNKVEIQADDVKIHDGIIVFTDREDIVCAFSFSILESFICKK